MSTALDFANFEGPKLNKEWKPDDQDLIYTALNWLDGEGDADEDCGQQLVERLLAAWQSSLTAAPASAAEPTYWVRINSSGKATFWEVEVPDGIPLYKRATAPNSVRPRNDCLEEAARICEALAASVMHPNQTITDRCAAAIRAAKGDNWHD
jgi:hypothetical protein